MTGASTEQKAHSNKYFTDNVRKNTLVLSYSDDFRPDQDDLLREKNDSFWAAVVSLFHGSFHKISMGIKRHSFTFRKFIFNPTNQ